MKFRPQKIAHGRNAAFAHDAMATVNDRLPYRLLDDIVRGIPTQEGMPITYRIDPDSGVVFRRFAGETTAEDFERHWREMMSDPALPAEGPLLLVADMRECEMQVYGEDVHQIVHCVIEPLLAGRRWFSAVVVSTTTQCGVTNQFMVYSERCGVTQMFFDMEDAIRWLSEFRSIWRSSFRSAGSYV